MSEGNVHRLIIVPALIISVMIGVLSCTTQQVTQDEITTFINDFEKKSEFLSRRLAEAEWDYFINSKSDSLDFYRSAYRAMFADAGQLMVIKNYLAVLKDETYRRKLELIYRQYQRGVIDFDRDIIRMTEPLVAQWERASRNIEFEASLNTAGQLLSRLAAEPDRGRQQAIYEALNRGSDRIAEELGPLVRKRNQVASRLGYNSYYDLMLKSEDVDKAELSGLINDLDQMSAVSYRAIIDSLKDILQVDQLREWDILHALHRLDGQCEPFYLADNQKSLVEATLGGLGFKLRSMPIYFGAASLSAPDPGKTVLSIKASKDVRIPIRLVNGEESLERLLEQVGKALYEIRIDPQDFLLAHPPAACFEAGTIRMLSALTELGNWKLKYAAMPEPLVAATTALGKFRSLHKLRKMLVDVYFEQRLYTETNAEPQKIYEELFEKYMLFPLEADVHPWATIDYVSRPVKRQNDLIGECIAAQTYHYLLDKYGAVLDDLHTREFLVQNYYRFGARDDWQTLLERGTGEKLKAKYYPGFPFN